MTVFLIILAVLAVLFILLLNLSATFTVIYDKGWKTRISVLFFEKDIELSKLLSFLLFPEKRAKQKAQEKENKKSAKDDAQQVNAEDTPAKAVTQAKATEQETVLSEAVSSSEAQSTENTPAPESKAEQENPQDEPAATAKPNPIAKIWNEEGIVGILSLAANALQSANSAIITLIRGLHIYSLYVMIIVGGADAAATAQKYAHLCSWYYPVKGMIKSTMKVDRYDDVIQPDFLADVTEFEMQFIGSISVGLLLKTALKAAAVFVKTIIQDKKLKKSK